MGVLIEDLVNIVHNATNLLLNALDLNLSLEQDTIHELSSTVTIGLSVYWVWGMVQPHMDLGDRMVLIQTLMCLNNFTKQCILHSPSNSNRPTPEDTEVSDMLAQLSTASEVMALQ